MWFKIPSPNPQGVFPLCDIHFKGSNEPVRYKEWTEPPSFLNGGMSKICSLFNPLQGHNHIPSQWATCRSQMNWHARSSVASPGAWREGARSSWRHGLWWCHVEENLTHLRACFFHCLCDQSKWRDFSGLQFGFFIQGDAILQLTVESKWD